MSCTHTSFLGYPGAYEMQYVISCHSCQYIHIHIYINIFKSHTTCYVISTQFIQIYQLCIYSQIYNHTTCNSTISTINFKHPTHGHFWSNSHKPGTVFTVPKQSKWAVCGQPTHPTSVPLGGTEFHAHFRPPTHQNTIYYINYDTNTQISL